MLSPIYIEAAILFDCATHNWEAAHRLKVSSSQHDINFKFFPTILKPRMWEISGPVSHINPDRLLGTLDMQHITVAREGVCL